jgi:hypothetical protein
MHDEGADVVERLTVQIGVLLALCCACACAGPVGDATACDAGSHQQFGISAGCFDIRATAPPTATNLAPDFFQAGGHPYEVDTTVRLNAPAEAGEHSLETPEPLKDASIGLPPGMAVNPAGAAQCSMSEFTAGIPACPPASQVGTIELDIGIEGQLEIFRGLPLFNLGPSPGAATRLGFGMFGLSVVTRAKLASGGTGGAVLEVEDVPQIVPVSGIGVSLWGVPADALHTPDRACPNESSPTFGGPSCAAGVPPRAFVRLPTSCTGPTTSSVGVDSWMRPGVISSAAVTGHLSPGILGDPTDLGSYPTPYPGLSVAQWGPAQGNLGCDLPPFNPTLQLGATGTTADSPTGLDIALELPQGGLDAPEGVAESDLRSATFWFPRGFSLNAAVANGLGVCTAQQVGLDSIAPASCPDSSKLGTLEIRTALLAEPLHGWIFAAARDRGSPDSALGVYFVAENEGTAIKLAGRISVDEASGRLYTALSDFPQIPMTELRISFFSGQRAPFATPQTCGEYSLQGRLVPWARDEVSEHRSTLAIDSAPDGRPCSGDVAALPFSPEFSAGVADPIAGAETSLRMTLSRRRGEQELGSVDVSLPPGLMASLRGVATCPNRDVEAAGTPTRSAVAELAQPSCPAASEVGTLVAAAGAGSEPFYLKTGRLYLAGPYQGASRSLAAIVPLLAGPLDSGVATLRLPLRTDPRDGHLELAMSLLPLRGDFSLELQSLTVSIDRAGFLVNPTRCRQTAIKAGVVGTGGGTASLASPFFIHDCGALGFRPKLSLWLLGGERGAARAGHPGLRAVVRPPRGGANLRRAALTLPGSEQLDPAHVRGVCSERRFEHDRCPEDSAYGFLRISSPLAERPLEGTVYMRPSDRKFPDLVAALRGDIGLDVVGRVSFDRGRIRLLFDSLPDLPIRRFELIMPGGRHGILINNEDLCQGPVVAGASLSAQNGKTAKRRMRMRVVCPDPTH